MRRRRAHPTLWRHEHLVAPLIPLAFFERACAHARLGWLPKIGELPVKVALGLQQRTDLATSAKL